ncbi:MAG: sigma-70 family RNA polymerase sigma factor [Porphyromonadaceae bacterium]|nr:sigma-70 family RNA polymerase sigma factor [Porphyromonadaceae bacterium]
MMSLCIRYTADREQAKDVVQDGFIKIFTKISQFQSKGSLSGWIRQIFVNTALEHLSKKDLNSSSFLLENISESDEYFDNQYFESISEDDLLECISELPIRIRTVFNMYAIEGFSHAEIADKLGIKEGSSRVHFSKARKLLQESVLNLLRK